MPSVRFQHRRKSVCIIIPACNELEALPRLRAELAALEGQLHLHYDTEYIVVDDGRTDGSSPLLPSLAPEGRPIRVLTHPVNRGIGAAFRTGFRQAQAQIVCTVDADCTYGLNGLPAMIAQVDRGVTDVVVASPYHPDGGVEGVPALRLLLSQQCSRLYRIFGPLKLYTYTSIFRVYRGSFVRDTEFASNGFESAVEILFSADQLGYRVSESPMVLHRRQAGSSKMALLRTIRKHMTFLTSQIGERYAVKPRTRTATEPVVRGPVSPLVRGLAEQLPQDVQR